MITSDLYQKVLIDPVLNGHDELFIVSGYSSATFLSRHLYEVISKNPDVKINLLIGMKEKRRDHAAYMNIYKSFGDSFRGYYFDGTPQVHSKVYCWLKDKTPSLGFSGSANYSQYGFFNSKQQNQMTSDNASQIKDYFLNLQMNSVQIKDYIVTDDEILEIENIEGSLQPGAVEWITYNESVRISLLSKNGELPGRSGLNWGQRPEHNRDPDQAYLSIKSPATIEGFLPEKKFTFTLLTDDGVSLDCTVQQDGRKAVSSTNDNSELGRYFRNRLGVGFGELVTKDHLMNYGRTDFLLKKLDQETFYLDFKAT